MLIKRELQKTLVEKWDSGEILILIGPRQVGKTTLFREMCGNENYLFINGDDPADQVLLENVSLHQLKTIIGNDTQNHE